MPNPPGWPCIIRYAGVTAPCVCRPFFERPCDTAPFYFFESDELQDVGQWLWAQGVNWLEHWQFAQTSCAFHQKYNEIFSQRDFSIEIGENPLFEQGISIEPFRVMIECKTITVDVTSHWFHFFDYGSDGPYPRDIIFVVTESAWTADPLNSSNAVKPLGQWRFYPRLCQPGWYPNHPPQ